MMLLYRHRRRLRYANAQMAARRRENLVVVGVKARVVGGLVRREAFVEGEVRFLLVLLVEMVRRCRSLHDEG